MNPDCRHKIEQIDEVNFTSLCCCEYFNKEGERAHILTCCCNCEAFDEVFTNFVTCRSIDSKLKTTMLLTFQDRLRIPWRGGAKQISLDTTVPMFLIPIIVLTSAINEYTAFTILSVQSVALLYGHWYVKRRQIRTRFFCMWIVCAVCYITILFEFSSPLLEVMPEENFVLVVFSCCAIYCFYKVRLLAPLNQVVRNKQLNKKGDIDNLPDITEVTTAEEEGEEAASVEKSMEVVAIDDAIDQTSLLIDDDDETGNCHRVGHCDVCAANILKFDHHSYWLACCIGASNYRYYVFGLLFGDVALAIGSNLTLTSVCHPLLLFQFMSIFVMLPDDCSEVFDAYESGISFVIGVYAILMALYVSAVLIKQLYLITMGLTLYEHSHGQIRRDRKTAFMNWRTFLNLSSK